MLLLLLLQAPVLVLELVRDHGGWSRPTCQSAVLARARSTRASQPHPDRQVICLLGLPHIVTVFNIVLYWSVTPQSSVTVVKCDRSRQVEANTVAILPHS